MVFEFVSRFPLLELLLVLLLYSFGDEGIPLSPTFGSDPAGIWSLVNVSLLSGFYGTSVCPSL